MPVRHDSRGRFTSGADARSKSAAQKTIVNKGERSRRSLARKKAKAALSGNRIGAKGTPRTRVKPVGKRVVTRTETRFKAKAKRKAKGIRRRKP